MQAVRSIEKKHSYRTFGSVTYGRRFTSASYRYGFNGKEKDDEVKGSGNSYDFGARIYDPRLGRWLAIDPASNKYPDLSTYNFVANNPILAVDPDGEKIIVVERRGFLGIGRKTVEYIPGKGYSGQSEFVKNTWTALNALSIVDEEGIALAVSNEKEVKIKSQSFFKAKTEGAFYNNKKAIKFNPLVAAELEDEAGNDNGKVAAYRILGHEIRHWLHKVTDKKAFDQRSNPDDPMNTPEIKEVYTDSEEKLTIEQENEVSKTIGNPERVSHHDVKKFYKAESPTTTDPMPKQEKPKKDKKEESSKKGAGSKPSF